MNAPTIPSAPETLFFAGRRYTVVESFPVTENMDKILGLTAQQGIQGERGAVYLLQTFKDGTRRAISMSGARVITELPPA